MSKGEVEVKKSIFILPLLATLAGCMTAQEREAQLQAKLAAQDDASCKSYGAQPGTSQYMTCRTSLQSARLSAPKINVEAPAPAYQPYRDPPPPVHCLTTGAMTTCS